MQGVRGVIVALANRAHGKGCVAAAAALICALAWPALASAHIERASYWPDPAPDCSVQSVCRRRRCRRLRSLASAVSDDRA